MYGEVAKEVGAYMCWNWGVGKDTALIAEMCSAFFITVVAENGFDTFEFTGSWAIVA